MFRWIMKIMGQGMVALIPICLTIGLIVAIGIWFANLLSNPLKSLFPGAGEAYLTSMGILSALALIFLVGLLMKLWVVRKLFDWVERPIKQLPLVKTVYSAIQDVMKFLSAGKTGKKGDMVVMVTHEKTGWRQLGIVTRQEFGDLPPEIQGDNPDLVAVYMPFSYQMGGFTYFIPRSQCQPVPGLKAEDAMRYSVMAWLGSAK